MTPLPCQRCQSVALRRSPGTTRAKTKVALTLTNIKQSQTSILQCRHHTQSKERSDQWSQPLQTLHSPDSKPDSKYMTLSLFVDWTHSHADDRQDASTPQHASRDLGCHRHSDSLTAVCTSPELASYLSTLDFRSVTSSAQNHFVSYSLHLKLWKKRRRLQ